MPELPFDWFVIMFSFTCLSIQNRKQGPIGGIDSGSFTKVSWGGRQTKLPNLTHVKGGRQRSQRHIGQFLIPVAVRDGSGVIN